MSALNKVMQIGRLGRDPESKQVGSSQVANFSIAITEKFKNKEGVQQEKTEWVNIVCWNRQAEIATQYLKKGSLVYVEGKMQTRSWDDNGQKRYATEVVADRFQMLGGRQESQDPAMAQNNQAQGGAPEDDLPF